MAAKQRPLPSRTASEAPDTLRYAPRRLVEGCETAPESLRHSADDPGREGFHCPICDRDIVTAVEGVFRYKNTGGSPQRFCSSPCRQAAYRRRKAGVAETVKGQFRGGRNRRLTAEVPVAPTEHDRPADE